MNYLNKIDTQFFLFLNGFHKDFWDFIMVWLSNIPIWIPFYIFLIYLFIKHYGKKSYILIIIGLLLVTATDMISYHFFKLLIQRPRPCHEPSLQGLVYIVNGHCGGPYGFISSHAANTFGLALYVTRLLGNKIKFLSFIIILWASVISYSRIYLGLHYPGDIICGALFGALCGYIFSLICLRIINKQS